MGKKPQSDGDNSELNQTVDDEKTFEEKVQYASPISKPMASKKLTKKCYKLVKKAMQHRDHIRSGLKDVQKRLRKGERGLVIFAGDVTPVEIMCHLPIVCEEKDIPYCFVPSRADLGAAMGVKRACLMVLIREHEDFKPAYDECMSEIKHLAIDL